MQLLTESRLFFVDLIDLALELSFLGPFLLFLFVGIVNCVHLCLPVSHKSLLSSLNLLNALSHLFELIIKRLFDFHEDACALVALKALCLHLLEHLAQLVTKG